MKSLQCECSNNETLEIIQIWALFLILFQPQQVTDVEPTALAREQLPEGP